MVAPGGGSRVNSSPTPASSPSYPTLPKPSTAGPYLSRPGASSTHPGAGPGGPSSSPGAAWSGEPAITSRAATAAPSNTAISKEAHRASNAQWLDPHRVPIWERPLAPPRRDRTPPTPPPPRILKAVVAKNIMLGGMDGGLGGGLGGLGGRERLLLSSPSPGQQLAQQQAAQQHQMFQQMVAQQQLHQQAVQQHMLQQYHHMHQQQYVLMGTEEAEFGQQRSGERPAPQTAAYPPPFSATLPAPGSGRPYTLAPAAGQDVALGRPAVPEAVRAGQGGRGAPADPGGLEQLRDEAQQHWQTASAAHGALSSAMADALGQAASPGDGSGSKAPPVSRLAQAHAGRSRS
ncbi:hypothetical protein QJQ45_000079 [Haematococcus lacustris]|nr:hypothetical protein QJQ45_000079 [Haematococcus lacustris]